MSDELRARLQRQQRTLRRLVVPPVRPDTIPGVQRGVETPLRRDTSRHTLEELLPGDLVETPHGTTYIIRTPYAHDHQHGGTALAHWLTLSLQGAGTFCKDERLLDVHPKECLFLDTETTGLGGAGTLVFLVGVGRFTDSGFEVSQYFLRSPAEEVALLHHLQELAGSYRALVTFNGRSFDVPLLGDRYTVNRRRSPLNSMPNFDLLPPSRRLWKRRLESCRLSSLETHILGIHRTGDDVPGFMIPQLYTEFLQTGRAHDMQKVVYHNLVDVVSMVALAARVVTAFDKPQGASHAADALSLARWYDNLDRKTDAEGAFRTALSKKLKPADRVQALSEFAALLKRSNRAAEAVELWQQLAQLQPESPAPPTELAKYYEWTAPDYPEAYRWAQFACDVARTGDSFTRAQWLADAEHRLARLGRKLALHE